MPGQENSGGGRGEQVYKTGACAKNNAEEKMHFEMLCRSISALTAAYCLCPHAEFKITAGFFTPWADEERGWMAWAVCGLNRPVWVSSFTCSALPGGVAWIFR